jgi:hypothetical protein
MRLFLSPNRNGGIGRQLAFIGLFGLLLACTDTGDPKVIDFKKTIPVAHPGEETSSQPVLRVAVGAMVSPKETFVHYRQLLDYMGEKMGMDVDLVQRKTYGETSELVGNGGIDLAFICSGPYATGKGKYGFELLASRRKVSIFASSFRLENCRNDDSNVGHFIVLPSTKAACRSSPQPSNALP